MAGGLLRTHRQLGPVVGPSKNQLFGGWLLGMQVVNQNDFGGLGDFSNLQGLNVSDDQLQIRIHSLFGIVFVAVFVAFTVDLQ